MYEIWLAMNIAYETALGLVPALAPLVLMWAVMMVINRKKLKRVKPVTLAAVAVLLSLAAVLALPSLSQSTLADMGYWVDWTALLGMAAGVGVAAAVLLWPVLAMRQR
jgi:drug/metabolite transporter (DMT)-like permease